MDKPGGAARSQPAQREKGIIQEKGTTTRTRLDLRTKELDSVRWMFNLLVMFKSTVMGLECPERIEQLTCFCSQLPRRHGLMYGSAMFVRERNFRRAGGEEPAGVH